MSDFDPKRMPPPMAHHYQVPPPTISSVPGALLHENRQSVDYGGSPKRLSLDERLERELGIKVEQQQEQLVQPHVTSLPATVPTYDSVALEEQPRAAPTEKEQAMAAAQMVTTKLLEMQAAKEAERRRKREQRLAERQRQLQQSQEGGERVAAARILEQVELQELASEEQKVILFCISNAIVSLINRKRSSHLQNISEPIAAGVYDLEPSISDPNLFLFPCFL
jgi:hypothetical protein